MRRILGLSRVDTTPRLSPKEWLEQLTTVDFSDPTAITDHQLGLIFYLQGRFDLVTDGEMDTFAVVPYLGALFTEELPRHDSSSQTISEDVDPHPSLISLQSHPIFEPSVSGQPLPSLVLPVGQLNKKSNGKVSKIFLDTDYVLVIDAVTPGHPVWLIYDRNPLDDIAVERNTVNSDEQPLIFKGIGHNFDAAQIFPSVRDWICSYGNVDFAQFEASIKAICITGAVQAKRILLSEAEVLFRQ
ncbi:hypothetical protein FPCIR_12717 [Fusarium pseudocircinatum]|uniref:Uncharacterized protein n=1 Tax=Fusarium pseudocircinatum TaxID=56676 RepID=A0A8H5KQL8_9HYPO|nr:hypothetical protein FPCIR_12717 [Fusarium pseudocircinatum]